MSVEILIVFVVLAAAIVLFAWERVSFDVTAVIIVSTLLLTGILSPEEGLSGFSNVATITIGAMFVLSEGLRRTGALNRLGNAIADYGRHHRWLAMVVMMMTIGVVSGFINNTAAVAIFIPVVIGCAADLGMSPSKLLMPLSFASMFGGVCTLIGTSTNILVSSIAEDHELAPFGMFEFLPLGLIFFGVGFLYVFTVGLRLVPARRTEEELTGQYDVNAYLTDVIVEPTFEYVGRPFDQEKMLQDLDLDVLAIFRPDRRGVTDGQTEQLDTTPLRPGDVLRIRGSAAEIDELLRREDLTLRPTKEWFDVDLEAGSSTLLEAVVAPDSALQASSIRDVDFPERFGAIPLAIRHRGELQQDDLGAVRLSGGDSVLLAIDRERIVEIEREPSFVLATEVGVPSFRPDKLPYAVAIIAGVVVTAAVGLVPIVVSALTGCLLLVLVGCLTTEEAYNAINWKVIFLLAGVLPLGVAMEKTGTADLLSEGVLGLVSDFGPVAAVSGFFFLSMMLTNVISNQATAALLAPVAIQAAQTLDVSARPLLMAITFAASLSFMTPVGYQTNTLIYGPGQYRFTDFTKVGTPLNLLFWILATFLIPIFWPL